MCGGAYNSPQLLMLSGIGRPEELELLQIPLVAESPEVGMNLQDHPTAGVTYFCRGGVLAQGRAQRRQPRPVDAGPGAADVQRRRERRLRAHARRRCRRPTSSSTWSRSCSSRRACSAPPAHGFTLSACVLKPQLARDGRGHDAGPHVGKPFIVHGYYTDPEDVRSGVAGLRMVMDFVPPGAAGALRGDAERGARVG